MQPNGREVGQAMRIESIVLKNYRQFRDVVINLDKQKGSSSDLHIMVGDNGTGKTNILNAINWCLYGDEPHLSRQSEQLPLPNVNALRDVGEGGTVDASVQLVVSTSGGSILLKRSESFIAGNGEPKSAGTKFQAVIPGDKGNREVIEGSNAIATVERFVPNAIREFFFFDGERLDDYFKVATSHQIRQAIFDVSQVRLLQVVRERLGILIGDLRREAGRKSPALDKLREDLESKRTEFEATKTKIADCEKQISVAKTRLKDYEEKLRRVPDVAALEEKVKALNGRRKEEEAILEKKLERKREFLIEYAKLLMLYKPITEILRVIEDKRRRKEIPPPIEVGLLRDALRRGTCPVCTRDFDAASRQRASALLDELRRTSDVGRRLIEIENPAMAYQRAMTEADSEIRGASAEIDEFQRELNSIDSEISENKRSIAEYANTDVRKWHEEREKLQETHDELQQQLGDHLAQEKKLRGEIDQQEEQFDKETEKQTAIEQIRHRMTFCNKAISVLDRSTESIMEEVRVQIERETQRHFLALVWKLGEFKGVSIKPDYTLSVPHSSGFEALGSLSAAERQELAMAFTLALHTVSGFDSPLLIDTPVARVSASRAEFAEALLETSQSKQLILLFTPKEYTEEVEKVLAPMASTISTLDFKNSETTLEVSKGVKRPGSILH